MMTATMVISRNAVTTMMKGMLMGGISRHHQTRLKILPQRNLKLPNAPLI